MRGSIVWLSERDSPDAFPPVERALREPDGLLAAGGDLSPARLLAAYKRGIFPWYSHGQPILWWCPDPRAVLFPGAFRTTRSLAKSMRNKAMTTRIDSAFATVIAACGSEKVRPEGTWLSPEMQAAYLRLHHLGHAHSVETWMGDRLVGGLYGVAIGAVFFGESMFSLETDASKIALRGLCDHLQACGFHVIDCQMATPHLQSLGATLLPRAQFIQLLASHASSDPSAQRWQSPANPESHSSAGH
jgi:leucyl/phenylalanyl-tRNA---protein transferase